MVHPILLSIGIFVVLFLVLCVVFLYYELSKPPPKGGSPYTLPNGMGIQHWQAGETDFLYTEIFGGESAYSRGGLVFRPGALILDVGANIGMFSLFAGERCGGEARIVSFEPIPSTHSVLQANAELALARSGGKVRIQALNVGLSSLPAAVTFEHHPHFTVWSTNDAAFAEARLARIIDDMPRALDTNPSWLVRACFPRALARALAALVLRRKVGVTERVPVRLSTLSATLDDLGLGEEDIDFLKVDVEGHELDVLKGIREEHWGRVQQVALEVENFDSRDAVVAILEKHGFATSHFASERERNPGVLSEVRAWGAGITIVVGILFFTALSYLTFHISPPPPFFFTGEYGVWVEAKVHAKVGRGG